MQTQDSGLSFLVTCNGTSLTVVKTYLNLVIINIVLMLLKILEEKATNVQTFAAEECILKEECHQENTCILKR